MLSQNPDKKQPRSHRGNKSPRRPVNCPQPNPTTFVSGIKTRSALKSPQKKIENEKIRISDPAEELDDFVNEIDRALNKSKSKRK